jgi:hypothetical protein
MERDFLLQIRPTEFRLYDAINRMSEGTTNILLADGTVRNRRLRQGGLVYLWDAGQGLVGRGTVLEERAPRPMPAWQQPFSTAESPAPNAQRAVIRVDLRLNPPLSRSRIQQDPVLVKAKFFKNLQNIQGAVFYVDSEAAKALERLSDTDRRTADEIANRQRQPRFRRKEQAYVPKIHKWWETLPSEIHWLEVTRRPDIGVNLNEHGDAFWATP